MRISERRLQKRSLHEDQARGKVDGPIHSIHEKREQSIVLTPCRKLQPSMVRIILSNSKPVLLSRGHRKNITGCLQIRRCLIHAVFLQQWSCKGAPAETLANKAQLRFEQTKEGQLQQRSKRGDKGGSAKRSNLHGERGSVIGRKGCGSVMTKGGGVNQADIHGNYGG